MNDAGRFPRRMEEVLASGTPMPRGGGSSGSGGTPANANENVNRGGRHRREVVLASGTPLPGSCAQNGASDGGGDNGRPIRFHHAPKPMLHVVNVVSTVDLSIPLDLVDIASKAINVEYNPIYAPGLLLRVRKPAYTMGKIQASGKMVVIGGTSVAQNYASARKLGKLVYKYSNDEPRFRNYTVTNIMAKTDTRFKIDLPKLATHRAHLHKCDFDPESTTGAIYRIEDPKVSANVYHNGKVTLKGAKSEKELHRAFDVLFPILQQFRKNLQ